MVANVIPFLVRSSEICRFVICDLYRVARRPYELCIYIVKMKKKVVIVCVFVGACVFVSVGLEPIAADLGDNYCLFPTNGV